MPLTPFFDPTLWPRLDEGQERTAGEGSLGGGEDPPEAWTPWGDHRKLGSVFSLEEICFPALTTNNPPRTLLGFRTQFSEGFRGLFN